MKQRKALVYCIVSLFMISLPSVLSGKSTQAAHGATRRTSTPSRSIAPLRSLPAVPADKEIAALLREISPSRMKATVEKLVSFHTRSTISSMNKTLPPGQGITAARDWIEQEFNRYSRDCGGCLKVQLDTFTETPSARIPQPIEMSNIYATMQGTDPESAKRVYLVTGHYDSRNSDPLNTADAAPGANDDASGTAVSLECARVLSKHKFRATILFLTVAGEEQGLNGSRHFAKLMKSLGVDVEAVLNNDIVGGNTTPGDTLQRKDVVRVFSEGIPLPLLNKDESGRDATLQRIRGIGSENDSPSRQLARYIEEAGRSYLPISFQPAKIFRPDRYLRGGDHTSFNEQGFAAVRMTEWREDYNHQHQNVRTEGGVEYGDLIKFDDFNYMANVARVNAATLASLASAPAPPANVKILAQQLENDTTLQWDPAPSGLATSYEVLWRSTTSPDWEHKVPAPQGTKITLPQSKDNVIFGIRSVDKSGHRSLVVIPTPSRERLDLTKP